MRRAILLLLTTLTLSAAIGCATDRTNMGSQYAQPFDFAFQGAVPPIFPASTLNDEFNKQHPPNNPAFPGGYVQLLGTKWATFDPGGQLALAAIDQQRVMALLTGNGEKVWSGVYEPEQLPIPGVGQAVAYDIYARALAGSIGSGYEEDYDPQLMGLLLGVDMAGAPTTTDLIAAFLSYSRVGNVVEGFTTAAAFAAYDSPVTPLGELAGAHQFLRASVTSENNAGVYDTRVQLSASVDGIGWISLARYDDLAQPLRHVGLGIRSEDDTDILAYFDFVRYYPASTQLDVHDPTTGGIQYLGAV